MTTVPPTGEREGALDPERLAEIEARMKEAAKETANEPCLCGRVLFKPSWARQIDTAWILHSREGCSFKQRPQNATDAEWAETEAARRRLIGKPLDTSAFTNIERLLGEEHEASRKRKSADNPVMRRQWKETWQIRRQELFAALRHAAPALLALARRAPPEKQSPPAPAQPGEGEPSAEEVLDALEALLRLDGGCAVGIISAPDCGKCPRCRARALLERRGGTLPSESK